MKKQTLLSLAILAGSLFSTNAEALVHEFIHIEHPIAEKYIVSQKNIRKYTEWQNPPVTYWGPTENGVDSEISFKFPLNKKGTPLHLIANLASFNFDNRGGGRGTGSSSLWGSNDGKTWTLLLDNPTPDRIDSYMTYDKQLPKELLSGSEVWIQVRMRVEGAPNNSFTTAQFSRSASNAKAPVFSIKEPTAINEIQTRPELPTNGPASIQSESAEKVTATPSTPNAPENAQAYTLDQLIGKELVDANGSPVDPASLKGKFVGIYFSAHWCGPCRTFTPKLVEFRNQIPEQFDVVFASSDRDAAAMLSYMKEAGMPWPALPFGSPQKALLDSTFNIRSIPTLIVLDPAGRLASRNARNDVASLSPKDALAKWKNDTASQKPAKIIFSPPSIMSSAKTSPPQNTSLEPGKSLLGCPIGSSEEEVIKILGKPIANFRLAENEAALLYYDGTALLRFIDGKLQDGTFSSGSFLDINAFNRRNKIPYALSSGISIGNSLQQAKDILGDRLEVKKDYPSTYMDGNFLITLNYSRPSDPNDRDNLNACSIYSIEIKKPIQKQNFDGRAKGIDPGKSIFGCPLGATEAEIIQALGEPNGKVDLGPNKTGLFYFNNCALLILWDGVLGGGRFETTPMLRNRSSFSAQNTFSMTNGIALEAPLAKAKEILGDKLDIGESLYNISYQEGDSLVTIQSSCRMPEGVSAEVSRKDINNYSIHSIQIDPISKAQTRSPSTGYVIPPKKTFPARQNPGKFNPAEMVSVEGGTLSDKANLPGVKVASFFIGKYEVTNAEWMKIQSYAQKHGYTLSRPTRTDDPELPMEGVSRREAMLWCNAKSEKEGLEPVYRQGGQIYKSDDEEPEMNLNANGYRLPTEPEWEWAARGGIHSKGYKFSGSDALDEVAWHGDTGEKWSRPVGIKKPNELEIHDMSGNVYEWVWDIDIPTYGILGGSYMSGVAHTDLQYRLESPLRKFAKETGRARSLGFRLARNIPNENTPSQPSLPAQKQEQHKSPTPPKQAANQQSPEEKLLAPQQVESLIIPNWFKTPDSPKHILIDPGKSIFGCAYGSSVQEVIAILGPPTCEANYANNSVELFYGEDCILYFDEGKLCGVSINDIDNVISNIILERSAGRFAAPRAFQFTNTYSGGWKLSNGIHPMMELYKAQKIAPENYNEKNNSFTINNQVITLRTIQNRNRKYIEAITILPSSYVEHRQNTPHSLGDLNFLWANPSKSIAGCPLGASKSEVIATIGPPWTTLAIGENKEGLLYDHGAVFLLLEDGKLSGGEFHINFNGHGDAPDKIKNPFELANGIYLGMPLSKAMEILGNQLMPQYKESYARFQKMKYIDGPSLVILSCVINGNRSNDINNTDINSYDIESIRIAPVASAKK